MIINRLQVFSNRILRVLNSDVSLKDMIDSLLNTIQKETEFAAIGIRIKEGEDFPYFSQIGFSSQFIKKENSLISKANGCKVRNDDGSPLYECTCGLVINGMPDEESSILTKFGSFYTNNSEYFITLPKEKDPRLNPRNTCMQNGYDSIAIIPIRSHGKIIGTLQLNEFKVNAITEDLIIFFEDMSLAIGNALMRKNAEGALLESERHLKEIQSLASIGSYTLDVAEGKWVSDHILDSIFGIDVNYENTIESWLNIVHPDDRKMMYEYFVNEVIGKRAKFNKEYRILRINDGIELWVHGLGSLKFDDKNEVIAMVGTICDITERKVAEIERDILISNLLNRNNDLEEFSHVVSHNLRAPVANIIGLVEILKENLNLENSEKEILSNLWISANNLDSIIKDLNYILQIKKNTYESKKSVSLSHVIDEIKLSIGDLFKNEKAKIFTDFSEIEDILSVKSSLRSIFLILVSNSIKFCKESVIPEINIKSKVEDDKIVLTFEDNGLGIDLKKHGEKIFGLYKRFHFHTDGKGIGLFIVKMQVERLGGKIFVESELEKGTTFHIIFDMEKCNVNQYLEPITR